MAEGDLTAPHWAMLDCPLGQFEAAMTMVQRRGLKVRRMS
jgi:hypothetical protein